MVHHQQHRTHGHTRPSVTKTSAAGHQLAAAPVSHLYHSGPGPGPVSSDQGMMTMCQCNTFLDPYPSGQSSQWRNMVGGVPLTAALQHYCRVCNTQLNSCKQARIHVSGKKHEKRLAYLKFSLETSEAVNINNINSYPPGPGGQYVGGAMTNNNAVAQTGPMMSSALPTVYAAYPPPPPPCNGYPQTPAPAYYYPPAPSYPSQLGQLGQPGMYHYDQQQPTQPPTSSASLTHYTPHTTNHSSCNNRRGKSTASGTAAASHGVMSPSLTSGFSGSGDCKSTETCSLLSVASYSSVTPTAHHVKERQGEAGAVSNTGTRHTVNCEVCHLPFPSRAVLEHHLMGSRHARKVKAESVLRQLQENGAEFRATEATGDIRCEVCEVSVNSSHQLQAHMTGHKHKMRCARQGVAPNKTILTPASSTAPSTTPSEASAPVRSYSILVGRPQFGSRPNLYKNSTRGGRAGARPGHGDLSERQRRVGGTLNKLAKTRKIVRPRLKTDLGSRQLRIVKNGAVADIGRVGPGTGATDSTTESDEPGSSKQKPLAKKPENIDKAEAVVDDPDDSDEAKESEADQDSSNGQTQSGSGSACGSASVSAGSDSNSGEQRIMPRYSSIVSSNVNQITKASQTEPLRRLSVDGCDLMSGSGSVSVKTHQMTDNSQSGKENTKSNKEKEPRRRSVSASYNSQLSQSLVSNNNNNNNNNYHCNLCQISVNSQSQLAQHMNSNKHKRLSVALQSHMTGGQSVSVPRNKTWYNAQKESLVGQAGRDRECNVREIPMLSMFLQRLHQHHYFPPIRDDEDTNAETHR